MDDLQAAEDVDALQRRGSHDATGDTDGPVGTPLGAHRQAVHRELDVDALRRRRGIASPLADRLEDGVARERLGEHAREPAVGTERGRTWMAGARTSLFVPVLKRFYLAVPHRGAQAAEVRVYETQP